MSANSLKFRRSGKLPALDQCKNVSGCQYSAVGRGAARADTGPGPSFPRHFTCTQATCRPPVLECLSRDHATRVLDEAASPDPEPGARRACDLVSGRALRSLLSLRLQLCCVFSWTVKWWWSGGPVVWSCRVIEFLGFFGFIEFRTCWFLDL